LLRETLVVHDVMMIVEGRLAVSSASAEVTAVANEVVYMPKGESVTIRSHE